MKKKCKRKIPKLEDGTQPVIQDPNAIKATNCPCPLDANGDCPCDPNKKIIDGGMSNSSNVLNFAGNALFGASMTGTPNPGMGAIGGAISGLTTGGPLGALIGAVNGFAVSGQAREDYEKMMSAQKDLYMKDRTFMPGQYEDGGVPEFDRIQAEDEEMLVLPNLEISKVKAKKKHKHMDDDEVTDAVKQGTIIFSAKGTIDLKKHADVDLSEALSFYDDKDNYHFKGLKVGDVVGKSGKITYAEAIERVKKYYPTSDVKNLMVEQTNRENLAARKQITEYLLRLQTGIPTKEEQEGVPKAAMGWPDLRKALEQIGYLDPKDPENQLMPGQTQFNSIPQNTKTGPGIHRVNIDSDNYSTLDTLPLDVQGAQYQQILINKADKLAKEQGWSDIEKQEYINEYAPFLAQKDVAERTGIDPANIQAPNKKSRFSPYETLIDPNQVSVPTTDQTGQQPAPPVKYNPYTALAEANQVSSLTGDTSARPNDPEISLGTQIRPSLAPNEKYNRYTEIADPNQISSLTTDNTLPTDPEIILGQQQTQIPLPEVQPNDPNAMTSEDQAINSYLEKIRSKYKEQRGQLDERFATDKDEISTLVRRKRGNNALQLGNQVLFAGLQSGYSNPALESTSLIEDQYRGVPAAVIEQQVAATGANANSSIHALAAAGVNPGEISNFAAKSMEAVLDAQGNIRSKANEMNTVNNRQMIADYRGVIQGNNQRIADSENKLQDFNNKKLAGIGEYLNTYLDNKDSIFDTEYRLTNKNEADYYDAVGGLDKGEAQIDAAKLRIPGITGAVNNATGAGMKQEDILNYIKTLSPKEKELFMKSITG